MSPGETTARLTVKDVERHRIDDMWEGDSGEQVGRPGGEPTEERAQKYVGTPADRGLVMCLMAYTKRTLIYTEIKCQLDATEGYASGLQDAAASCKPDA